MWVLTVLLGAGSLAYGGWLFWNEYSAWDSDRSMKLYERQMEAHREDFASQFRLTQESIQDLYAEDLTEMKAQLSQMSQELEGFKALWLRGHIESQLQKAPLSGKRKEQAIQVLSLAMKGCSDEAIAEQLQIGVGEVLLLKQLKKS